MVLDLSEAKTLSDIISQVGYALSIPLTTGRSDMSSSTRSALGSASANTLLILDNLEQVIDPAARAIERCVGDRLFVLAGDQPERLRLSAETVSAVRSLSVEEGVKLFARPPLRSDFEVTVGQRAARADHGGARLHAACDRAGRCADPPHEVEALAHQPSSGSTCYDTISSEHPARHQTLQAAIEWSWSP